MRVKIIITLVVGFLIPHLHAMESQSFMMKQLRKLFSNIYSNREQDLVDQLKKMDPVFNCCKKGEEELREVIKLIRKWDYDKFCLTETKVACANNGAINTNDREVYKTRVKDTLLRFALARHTLSYNQGLVKGVGMTITAWLVITCLCYLKTACDADYSML